MELKKILKYIANCEENTVTLFRQYLENSQLKVVWIRKLDDVSSEERSSEFGVMIFLTKEWVKTLRNFYLRLRDSTQGFSARECFAKGIQTSKN